MHPSRQPRVLLWVRKALGERGCTLACILQCRDPLCKPPSLKTSLLPARAKTSDPWMGHTLKKKMSSEAKVRPGTLPILLKGSRFSPAWPERTYEDPGRSRASCTQVHTRKPWTRPVFRAMVCPDDRKRRLAGDAHSPAHPGRKRMSKVVLLPPAGCIQIAAECMTTTDPGCARASHAQASSHRTAGGRRAHACTPTHPPSKKEHE